MSRKTVVCLITFDYELFLGRNFGNPEEILFAPTRKILNVCKSLELSSTFFPDVCSVWAYRAHGMDGYADDFEAQLSDIVTCGHDVGLHVHPHWLFSRYEDNEWVVSTDRMYLHELGFGVSETSAGAVVRRGVEYLEEKLRVADPDYRCTSFRAAGLALQPGERDLIRVLLASGIEMDLSMVKGLRTGTDTITIDYRRTPEEAAWLMSPETGIETAGRAGILEVPIGSFRMGLVQRLVFLLRRARSAGSVRGLPISRSSRQGIFASFGNLFRANIRYVAGNPQFILSCDTKGLNLKALLDGFDSYVNGHKDDVIFVSMINHPKLMFDEQMELLSEFVRETRKRYGEGISFQTCREVLAAGSDRFARSSPSG